MLPQNVDAVMRYFSPIRQSQQCRHDRQQERDDEEFRRPHPAERADHSREKQIRIEELEASVKLRVRPSFLLATSFCALAREDSDLIEAGEKPRESRNPQCPAVPSPEFVADRGGREVGVEQSQHAVFHGPQEQVTANPGGADDKGCAVAVSLFRDLNISSDSWRVRAVISFHLSAAPSSASDSHGCSGK